MISLLMNIATAKLAKLGMGLTDAAIFVPRSGTCLKDTPFQIRSVDDLKDNLENLECIFQAGIGFKEIPLGPMYGTLLLAVNSEVPARLSRPVYLGDYSYMTGCTGPDGEFAIHYFSQLRIVPGITPGVSKNTISPYPKQLAFGENPYVPKWHNIEALVMDFTVDTNAVCPLTPDVPLMKLKSKTMDPFGKSLPPISGYIDISVIVGANPDNGRLILLNKAMAYDDLNNELTTTLFYAVEVEDFSALPNQCFSGTENPFQCLETLTVPRTIDWQRNILPSPTGLVFATMNSASGFLPQLFAMKKFLPNH